MPGGLGELSGKPENGRDWDFDSSLSRDFWLSNGCGSYCSTSELGINSRKYHGLLSYSPNGSLPDALLLLSKIEDSVVVDGVRHGLSSNCYPGTVHPGGWRRISKFEFDSVSARWHYTLPSFAQGGGQFEIIKDVWMAPGANASFVRYFFPHSALAPHKISLELAPLVLGRKASSIGLPENRFSHTMRTVEFTAPVPWAIVSDYAVFHPHPLTYRNMQYPLEYARGEDGQEDLFSPGAFTCSLEQGGSVYLRAEAGARLSISDAESFQHAHARRKRLLSEFYSHSQLPQLSHLDHLVLAADSFVTRSGNSHGIIAGFPYFGIWGRDTFISLPGIAACTGRHALARDIISAMLKFEKGGLLPNFIGEGGTPSYNAADTPLLAIWSIWQLENEGGVRMQDKAAWWPALRRIAYHYMKGNGLCKFEGDGLLSLQNGQSTWMDAMSGGKPVTPRAGRRVDINALWVFSLFYLRSIADELGDSEAEGAFEEAYSGASASFPNFFNEYAQYFDDGITPTDGALRPNQLWALALPNVPVSAYQARSSLLAIREHLLTPVGLRTLAPGDRNYHPHYGGAQGERDAAYHQGAIWPWLLGIYTDAILRHQPSRAGETLRLLNHALSQNSGAHGTMAELFDPTSLSPAGCPSQAWSVAETLRASVSLYKAKYASGRLPDLLSSKI